MINKKYRIIEPIAKYEIGMDEDKEGTIFILDKVEKYEVDEIDYIQQDVHTEKEWDEESECWRYFQLTYSTTDGCKDFPFKIGDIVDFEQVEKWIEMGLQPMYFVEEVIDLSSKHENDKSYYNVINMGSMLKANWESGRRWDKIIKLGDFVGETDDFLIKFNFNELLKDHDLYVIYERICIWKGYDSRLKDYH